MQKSLLWAGAALLIILAVAGTAFLLADLAATDRAYVSRAAHAAHEFQVQTGRQIRDCYRGPPAQAEKCSSDAEYVAEQQYRDEYNLAAQQTSAWWTKVAGFGAIIASLIGLGSIALIFLTFWQTLKQANEIKQSVHHAGRSAVALEGVAESMAVNAQKIVESVEHQRKFGSTQLRAYVTVAIGGGVYQDEKNMFEARPLILNRGFTSARELRWRIACDVLPIPVPNDFKFPLPKSIGGGSDLDGQQDGTMAAVMDRRLSDEDAQAAKLGNGKALTVWGYVWYKDIFGKKHRRSFAQQFWWIPSGDRRLDGSHPLQVFGMHLQRHNRGN